MVLPLPPILVDVVFTATVSTFRQSRKRKQMTPSPRTSLLTSRALCPAPPCVARVSPRPPMGRAPPPVVRPRPLTTPAAAPPCTAAASASTSSPSTRGPRRTPPRSDLGVNTCVWRGQSKFQFYFAIFKVDKKYNENTKAPTQQISPVAYM